jgi:hypothetical protein
MAVLAQPLFYAVDVAQNDLVSLVFGALEQPAVDTVQFADEAGGDQDRELALAFLPGMDAVVVEDASLRFRVGDMALDITQYSVSPGPSGQGMVLRLPAPARLAKLDLSYTIPSPDPGPPAPPTTRLLVRPVLDGGFGPPIFVAPPFGPPSPAYADPRPAVRVDPAPNGRFIVSFPDLLGSAWLLQLGTGDKPDGLTLTPVVPTVNRVVLAAAPRNLSIVLRGPPDTPLWSNADVLLPDGGEQTVSFLPLAQRQMSAALQSSSAAALTLPLSLRFHSDTGAQLDVTARALTGHYTVDPLQGAPATLRLGGRTASLVLRAPGGLHPRDASATLTARMLGRALNGGSPPAPLSLPGHGLSVATDRMVAARLPIAPRGTPGEVAGAPVPLGAVALRITAGVASELALELRADAAGRPGAILAPAVVSQIAAGFDDWLDVVLPTPLPVAPGSAVWASARLTKGTLSWHAGDAAPSGPGASVGTGFVSIDKGASWGEATTLLQDAAPLLVQAFHAVDPPFPRPTVAIRAGASVLLADWFDAAAATGPKEFRLAAAPLPQLALDRLAAAGVGPGARPATALPLYSDTVLDLVVGDAVIAYDPNTARGT